MNGFYLAILISHRNCATFSLFISLAPTICTVSCQILVVKLYYVSCSALMDCVGCEKCRLWGKLQVLGLGTALKILFSVDGSSQLNQPVGI